MPVHPQTIRFSLVGATVHAVPADGACQRSHLYLNAAGLSPTITSTGELVFPFKNYPRIKEMSPRVTRIIDDSLKVFQVLLDANDEQATVFHVDRFSQKEVSVSWSRNDVSHSVNLPVESEYLLLMLDLQFVYSPKARALLDAVRVLPVVLGRATETLEGHIRISTQVPHLLEKSGIPHLFKISPGVYGVPENQRDFLKKRRDIAFQASAKPTTKGDSRGSPVFGETVPEALSPLVQEVTPLAAYLESTASLILEDSAYGELTALLLGLSSPPVVVVAHPQSWWRWYLYARYAGLSAGRVGEQKEVLLVDHRTWQHEYHRIVCDRLIYDCRDGTAWVDSRFHVAALNCQRVALLGPVPEFADKLRAAYLVRPVEFRGYLESLSTSRHPRDAAVEQHIAVYSRRFEPRDDAVRAFPLAKNVPVRMSRDQQASYARATVPPVDLARVQDILDLGGPGYLSSKASAALQMSVAHAREGSPLVAITWNRSAADLLNSLCRRSGLPVLAFAREDAGGIDSAKPGNILYYNTCMDPADGYARFSTLPPGGVMYYLRVNCGHSTALDITAFNGIRAGKDGLSREDTEYVRNYLMTDR